MFSSEEFGADSEMDRADNACQPKINPEKVITLSIVAIEGMIEEHDNPLMVVANTIFKKFPQL